MTKLNALEIGDPTYTEICDRVISAIGQQKGIGIVPVDTDEIYRVVHGDKVGLLAVVTTL